MNLNDWITRLTPAILWLLRRPLGWAAAICGAHGVTTEKFNEVAAAVVAGAISEGLSYIAAKRQKAAGAAAATADTPAAPAKPTSPPSP